MSPLRPQIALVVTDLDNTLYDWITFFVTAFYRMVETASGLLDIEQEELLDQLQEIHRRYHDSEYPYALLETRVVQERFKEISRLEIKRYLEPAFSSFNEARNQTLQLYPTVFDTLTYLRSCGTVVVGHTEASAPNAFFRLRKLECLPLISRLYALEHVGKDHPAIERNLRFQEGQNRIHFLRSNQRKPNPQILLRICEEYGIPPSQALYIGDSITRDIVMAKAAGTCSALAEYGLQFNKSLWNKLVRVTHWSDEDISRNAEARKVYSSVNSDVTLDKSFKQILEHYCFVATSPKANP